MYKKYGNFSSEITGDKDYTNGTTQKWQANAKVLVHYKVNICNQHRNAFCFCFVLVFLERKYCHEYHIHVV